MQLLPQSTRVGGKGGVDPFSGAARMARLGLYMPSNHEYSNHILTNEAKRSASGTDSQPAS